MVINELLNRLEMSQYRLSKESGVGQATISDLCSGKSSLEKCAAGTLYKLAKVLGVTVEDMIEAEMKNDKLSEYRVSFEIFKSNVCHQVKDKGDVDFIIETLETDRVRSLYNQKWYPECLYLLAMLDYLSRENDIPVCNNYNDIRCQRLEKPIYSSGVLLQTAVMHSDEYKKKAMSTAIPEFLRFNIVESEVRNVI